MTSNLPVMLFLVPFVAALVCAVMGWRRPRRSAWCANGAMLVTAALAVWAATRVFTDGTLRTELGGWAPPVGIEWVLDPLGALMAVLVSAVGAVALIGGGVAVRNELARREPLFYACALLFISGLMGMALTGDLFNLFVHLEVASLSAYALVAAGRAQAPRAALEYLIIGSIGASFYLLGVGFVYAGTGTLNMADAAARLAEADPRLNLTGLLLIVTGLGVKMGLFPLHVWMPGAYAAAPAAASALMAPLATKLAAYALLRVLFWVFGVDYLARHDLVLELLCWMGAAAMVFGAVKAASQQDLWRLLAYSSMSQMGLVALGVGLANTAGLTGAVLHIANDALMKGALFLAAGTMLTRYGIRRVGELSTLRGRAPWTATVVVVGGLSLIGIPPLCGFYGKWYVLQGSIEAGRWVFAAAILLGTLATAWYVFRLIEQLFFATPTEAAAAAAIPAPGRAALVATPAMVAMSVVLASGIVLLGLFSQPVVLQLIRPALPGGL